VVLLVTATLLLRSLVNLRNVEPGFDTNNLLLMEVTLPETVYGSPETVSTFYDRVVERLAGSPGVLGAGAAERVPVEGSRFNPNRSLEIEGRPTAIGQTRSVDDIAVTPGYLETLALPLRAGRLPAPSDGTNAPLVAVISESAAKRYFDTASPLGARLRLGDEPSPDVWRTVVGVVGDVRNDDIDQPPPPIVYVPASQRPSREMTFMVRVIGDPLAHVTTARAAIAAYDADVPVYDVESMEQLLAEDIQGTSVLSSLTTTFGILALVLAAVGIYGMLAYVVAHRTREMAIRIAVGARSLDVIRHVVGGGLRFVVIGLVLGLAVSLPLANVLRGVLYGISASDPATYAVVAAVLIGSALLACLVPARRALRLDPVVALRAE
jgi:putative ABC transport system permease protein